MDAGAAAVVHEIIERWNSQDTALDLIHPEVSWDASDFPDGEVYEGHEGVVRFVRRWVFSWDDYSMELEETIAGDDRVAALVIERGRSPTTGLDMQLESLLVFWVEGGQIVRMRGYLDRAAGLREAGLQRRAG